LADQNNPNQIYQLIGSHRVRSCSITLRTLQHLIDLLLHTHLWRQGISSIESDISECTRLRALDLGYNLLTEAHHVNSRAQCQ
jgi:hypothetical protein